MISKNQIKWIKSLQQRKFREEHGVFVVEGPKLVEELLSSDYEVHSLYGLPEYLETLPNQYSGSIVAVSQKELERISGLKSANQVLAVVKQMTFSPELDVLSKQLVLALDGINDPGNLGTIFRLADWFGIEQIWCAKGSVEHYNAKVVQSTMGAVFRVKVSYVDLPDVLEQLPSTVPVYGAVMDGDDLYSASLSKHGILVMGSESHGISAEVESTLSQRLTIPRIGKSESLNVSTAASILVAEFFRQSIN